jgi:hypothetical protein
MRVSGSTGRFRRAGEQSPPALMVGAASVAFMRER